MARKRQPRHNEAIAPGEVAIRFINNPKRGTVTGLGATWDPSVQRWREDTPNPSGGRDLLAGPKSVPGYDLNPGPGAAAPEPPTPDGGSTPPPPPGGGGGTPPPGGPWDHLPPPPDPDYSHNPPPPSNRRGFWNTLGDAMDAVEPYVPLATNLIKGALRPSPYAPMTWIEHQLSPEGRAMLYGRGPQIAPLYGYETRPFQIQPTRRRNPEEVFTSPWHDPNVSDVPRPGTEIGYPGGSAGAENLPWGNVPPPMRGGNQTPEERLGRSVDPLHANMIGVLWGTTHDAATGNVGGDVHTRATRGFGDPTPSGRVEPIRAPKPKN